MKKIVVISIYLPNFTIRSDEKVEDTDTERETDKDQMVPIAIGAKSLKAVIFVLTIN